MCVCVCDVCMCVGGWVWIVCVLCVCVRSCVCRSFYVAALITSPTVFILPAAPVEHAIAPEYSRQSIGKSEKVRVIDIFTLYLAVAVAKNFDALPKLRL